MTAEQRGCRHDMLTKGRGPAISLLAGIDADTGWLRQRVAHAQQQGHGADWGCTKVM